MIRNLALITLIFLASITIISCNKGNPKNTDLLGGKYTKLIVGKWQKVADTSVITDNGVLVGKTELGATSEFTVYNADLTGTQYIGNTVDYNFNYRTDAVGIVFDIPAISSGGVNIPAFTYTEPIRLLNNTDLVLHNDITVESASGNVTHAVRTIQTVYFKRR